MELPIEFSILVTESHTVAMCFSKINLMDLDQPDSDSPPRFFSISVPVKSSRNGGFSFATLNSFRGPLVVTNQRLSTCCWQPALDVQFNSW